MLTAHNLFRPGCLALGVILSSVGHAADYGADCPKLSRGAVLQPGALYFFDNPEVPLVSGWQSTSADKAEQISNIGPPIRFFYVVKRGSTGDQQSGAILIKRRYVLKSISSIDNILMANNLSEGEVTVTRTKYSNFHSQMTSDDPLVKINHVHYLNQQGSSDDSIDKRNSFLIDFPSVAGEDFIDKSLILRYQSIHPNGTCMDFSLFGSGRQSDLPTNLHAQTQYLILRIYELDHFNTDTSSKTVAPSIQVRLDLQ